MKSHAVSEQEQGTMQGALYGVRAFGSGAGPLIMGLLLAYFSSSKAPIYLPQVPYIFASILAIICVCVAWTIPEDIRLNSVKEEKELRRKLKEQSIISASLDDTDKEQTQVGEEETTSNQLNIDESDLEQHQQFIAHHSTASDEGDAHTLKLNTSSSFAGVRIASVKVLPTPAGDVQQ
jgi:hypothetical protein